mgnify:CR=1 FL=1
MNKTQVELYFRELSKAYPKKCVIILTGAAAGALYGRVRATLDVDFEAKTRDWGAFEKAVLKISLKTGIEAQYAEDIDRWSSITLMDYQKHTFLHKQFGELQVRLMDPEYWALGKLARYLDSDVSDMEKVFKKKKTSWRVIAVTAGKALRKSPKSNSCFLFRQQTEDFFKRLGRKIWGKDFNQEEARQLFYKAAGIRL